MRNNRQKCGPSNSSHSFHAIEEAVLETLRGYEARAGINAEFLQAAQAHLT